MDINRLYEKEFLEQMAKKAGTENKKMIKKIKAQKPKHLDAFIHTKHNELFETVDCLQCANCCRSLGPRILVKDIERLAKHLRMKPAQIIDTYLKIDEDNDYVFKEMPCPFLMPDNYCMIYENRPKACREYPHTDEKKMVKHLNLMQKNCSTCPVAYIILEDLKTENIGK